MKVVEVDGVVEGWSDKVLEGLRWWRWWRWRWWTDGGGGEAEGLVDGQDRPSDCKKRQA